MTLSAKEIGKRFGKNWIFRDQSFQFTTGDRVAITGSNGSGKSTLLQILAGYLTPTQGSVWLDSQLISETSAPIGFVSPYMEIIEEFTLREFLHFHSKFKSKTISLEEMADRASLPLNRPMAEFSTGMKQRAKLTTLFYFKNDLLFMDEPTANLDAEGTAWWANQVDQLSASAIILIASNQQSEIEVCSKEIILKKNTDH